MPKFNVGDKVRIPEGTRGAPREWCGLDGEIVDASASMAEGGSRPMTWEPLYRVRFGGPEDWVAIQESWLVAA